MAGTFEELVQKGGHFAQLVKQLQEENKKNEEGDQQAQDHEHDGENDSEVEGVAGNVNEQSRRRVHTWTSRRAFSEVRCLRSPVRAPRARVRSGVSRLLAKGHQSPMPKKPN